VTEAQARVSPSKFRDAAPRWPRADTDRGRILAISTAIYPDMLFLAAAVRAPRMSGDSMRLGRIAGKGISLIRFFWAQK